MPNTALKSKNNSDNANGNILSKIEDKSRIKEDDLYCRFEPDTTLLEVNDTYCKLFNLKREDIIGHKFIELISERKREEILSELSYIISDKEPIVFEHTHKLMNNTKIDIRWAASPICNNKGEVVELETIGIDITRTKLVKNNNYSNLKKILNKPTGVETLQTIQDKLEAELNIFNKITTTDYKLYGINVNNNKTSQDIVDTFINNSYKLSYKSSYIHPEINEIKIAYHKCYSSELGEEAQYFLEINENTFNNENNSDNNTCYKISKDLYSSALYKKYKKSAPCNVYKDIYLNFSTPHECQLILFDYNIDNIGRTNSKYDTMFFAIANTVEVPSQLLPDWVNSQACREKDMVTDKKLSMCSVSACISM